MFNRKTAFAALIALGAMFAGSAHAGNVQWSVSVNLPPVGTVVSNAPVFHAPAPGYYVPAPVYHAPAPVVVYRPAPPPVVVYRPVPVVYGDWHGWKHRDRHHHEHRGWRDDRRDDHRGGRGDRRDEPRFRHH